MQRYWSIIRVKSAKLYLNLMIPTNNLLGCSSICGSTWQVIRPQLCLTGRVVFVLMEQMWVYLWLTLLVLHNCFISTPAIGIEGVVRFVRHSGPVLFQLPVVLRHVNILLRVDLDAVVIVVGGLLVSGLWPECHCWQPEAIVESHQLI